MNILISTATGYRRCRVILVNFLRQQTEADSTSRYHAVIVNRRKAIACHAVPV